MAPRNSTLRRLDQSMAVPQEVLALLRGVPLLAVLAPRVVERLTLEAAPVRATAGEVVIAEGALGDQFYVIAAGRAEVTQAGAHVRELGAGSWFGELGLLEGIPRTATVVTTAKSTLLRIEGEAFLGALTAAPLASSALEGARARYIAVRGHEPAFPRREPEVVA